MKLKNTKETFFLGIGILSLLTGLTILIIFIFKLSYFYTLSSESSGIQIEDTGNVGNFIGGVIGTLLSFGSAFFIILTLLKQQEALVTQRNQFDIQQFENKFFQLLKVQQDIINAIEVRYTIPGEEKFSEKEHKVTGINAFENIFLRLKQQYYKIQEISTPEKPIPFEMKKFTSSVEEEQLNIMQDAFEKLSILMEIKDLTKLTTPILISKAAYSIIFGTYHGQLGHYFRHLYHILSFVYQSFINENSKNKEISQSLFMKYKSYVDLIQSQMSSFQLALLFYHGLCFKEIKKLIHLYDFLVSLAIQDIISEEHKDFYCETNIDGMNYPAILLNDRNKLIEMSE